MQKTKLLAMNGIEPKILKEETYDFEKTGRGYEYILRRKLHKGKLDLGPFLLKMIT